MKKIIYFTGDNKVSPSENSEIDAINSEKFELLVRNSKIPTDKESCDYVAGLFPSQYSDKTEYRTIPYAESSLSSFPNWLVNENAAYFLDRPVYNGSLNKVVKCKTIPFSQAPINASIFGFTTSDTTGNTNFAAFAAMAAAVTASGGYTAIQFDEGTYKINCSALDAAPKVGCTFNGLKNIIIDGSKATFLCVNDSVPMTWVMNFVNCTNVTLSLNWRGTNHTAVSNGQGGVQLKGGNSNIDYSFTSNNMFEGVRIGGGEDPYYYPDTRYEGNHDINIWCSCLDTTYACPVYLASNVNIWCQSMASAPGVLKADRAVYLSGCNNVRAVSRSKNLSVGDGVNIISISPRYTAPQMVGCTNIWMDATDLGTTNLIASQRLVKVNQVTVHDTSLQNTGANQDNIHINVTATMSATVWGNHPMVMFDSLGANAACLNTYTNIYISGQVNRLVANNYRLFGVESTCTGISQLDVTLINFHDTLAGNRCWESLAANIPTEVQTFLSDIGSFYFTTPAVQHVTNH